MISLQQVKKLENRVLKAVEMINNLRDENLSLRGRLQGYESKILELEETISGFKNEQQQIENGILDAIQKLDILEDSYNSRINSDNRNHVNGNKDPDEKQDPAGTLLSPEIKERKPEDFGITIPRDTAPETGVKNIVSTAEEENTADGAADMDIEKEEELDIF